MTLIYQRIPDDDIDEYIRIAQQAYGSAPAETRTWFTEQRRDQQLRGLYLDGRLVTQLTLHPFQIQTGLNIIPTGALDSVATPAEHRRRGYTARILRDVCDELRAAGTYLCLLYAFKESFYRRYGWMTSSEARRYTGAPDLFSSFRRKSGSFISAGVEELAEFDAIYRRSLRGRFGPLARSDHWWKDTVLSATYRYLWRDETGAARAYICYNRREQGDRRMMRIREAIALDPEARAQLFGFIADHDSQFEEISLRAPTDAPINMLLPDPLECTIELGPMLRLIDVAGALAQLRYPADVAGRLSIAVADDWIAENQATFALEVAAGIASCTRLPDGAPADLRCDVRTLTQIFTRYLRPRTAAAFGLLDVADRSALTLLEQLFAGLPPFHSDFY
jgi:predicted acetyltransferase